MLKKNLIVIFFRKSLNKFFCAKFNKISNNMVFNQIKIRENRHGSLQIVNKK